MIDPRIVLFCGVSLLVVASAVSAGAQTTASLPRVVLINNGTEETGRYLTGSFREGMRQAGQVEGRAFDLDIRYADRDPARVPVLIRESVAKPPAALVIAGLRAARLAHDATSTVPVVVATSSDLVDAGVVKSFARPGGNITGISDLTDETTAKRLELLKAALPTAARVAWLVDPDFPATPKIEARVRSSTPSLGISVTWLHAKDRVSLARALDSLEDPAVVGKILAHLGLLHPADSPEPAPPSADLRAAVPAHQ